MCGIAGFTGNFSLELLKAMGETIAHRGSDDHGEMLFTKSNIQVGLAHRRLSIIDLSPEGHQPMTVVCDCCQPSDAKKENKLWLTYNGELYNYKILRDELIEKGHQFHSATDSEVILHLYAEEGEAMLSRLNGMFAFALYDGRKKGDVLVARDGLGIKPLYYSKLDQGVLFASELKALLKCQALSRGLDLMAIHYYMAFLWCPAPRTMLQSVKKLEPGHALWLQDNKIKKHWCFYKLPGGNSLFTTSEKKIAEELVDTLKTVVDDQMIADVPVGMFLSGGLDSSAVAAMMRQANPSGKFKAYCAADYHKKMEGSPNDLPYAKHVAASLGVDLHHVPIHAGMINDLEKMLYHLDEPQADPAPLNAWLIAKQAKQDGIKVLMSGAGGDDIFSGYRRHWAVTHESFLTRLPKAMRELLAKTGLHFLEGRSRLPLLKNTTCRRAAKLLSYLNLPANERLISYFFWSSEQLRHGLYAPEVAAQLKNINAFSPMLSALSNVPGKMSSLGKMLYLETKFFLPDHNLNYTDKVAMAEGVEVRVPLIDPRLVNFAAQIPPHLKQKGRVGKSIFKKAMEPYLPNDVIYRPKTGFAAPLRSWLHHELKPMLDDVLSDSSIKQRGIFDAVAVRKLIKADRSGCADLSYPIFSLLCIEQWCRIFLD